ncbi:HypC/HybG/HupF family hydrogenase formation chaperone [Streptomyces acidiscabies]|uniref:HypC/HybG/HupF family hydrogenase formation chaperone n=1 Tax=Streptomyces acidiscabies TaxID=42234 RepID=UPI0009A1292E
MCLGIPGRVLEIHDDAGLRMATVDFGGVRREACLSCVPEADVGSYVVVHVGFAITLVVEAEAHRTLDVLRAMAGAVEGELGEELPPRSVRPAPQGRSAPAPGARRGRRLAAQEHGTIPTTKPDDERCGPS